MARNSESGHPINVANFELVVNDVVSYDGKYNPSKAILKPSSLTIQLTESKKVTDAAKEAETTRDLAIDAREVVFKPLGNLVTRVNNALISTDTTDEVDLTALTIVRKLQGRRATPKQTEEQKKAAKEAGTEKKEISSSQMSYDNRIDNFDKFIKLLISTAIYAPNESDLQIPALTTVLNTLKEKNAAVGTSETALKNARIVRNEVLYKPKTGMVDTALGVKTYIKSVFGATSPQYKKISKIRFTKPR